MADPRLYQIAVLASLLVYGVVWLDFGVTLPQVGLLLGTAVLPQALCDHLTARTSGRQPTVNVRSALISGLSLCLLLRTNNPAIDVLAAAMAIGGKFLI